MDRSLSTQGPIIKGVTAIGRSLLRWAWSEFAVPVLFYCLKPAMK
jgi:hypothetical protein